MKTLSKKDPEVIEKTYDILEKIIVSIDFNTKEELEQLADIMVKKVENGDYPQILKLAYADARDKIKVLSLEQLNEIKNIINS